MFGRIGCGIGSIVPLPFDEWFDVDWQDQADLMPE